MKVLFSGPDLSKSVRNTTFHMDAIPNIGHYIVLDSVTYEVKSVTWTISSPSFNNLVIITVIK